MKEETVFVSNDGARFASKEDCYKWEKISGNIALLRDYMGSDSVPRESLKPLKDLCDPYFAENARIGFSDFDDYLMGSDPEPKVRLKHLEILQKMMNFIFYGSCDPCVGD